MTDSHDTWYYVAGREQKGPFSIEQLTALASTGALRADTLVWSAKLTNWEPLGRTELASILRVGPLEPPPLAYSQPAFAAASPGQDARVSSLGQAVSACFSKYATFVGRANRAEFWYFYLFTILACFAAIILDMVIFGPESGALPITIIVSLALTIPNIAVAVRRLHDTNRSGWWYLVSLIPIAGPIALIVFWCLQGTPGQNAYG